jgi:hypothetical protein
MRQSDAFVNAVFTVACYALQIGFLNAAYQQWQGNNAQVNSLTSGNMSTALVLRETALSQWQPITDAAVLVLTEAAKWGLVIGALVCGALFTLLHQLFDSPARELPFLGYKP